jgi:hypothetical protein
MLSKKHKMFIELFRDDYFVWLRENSSVKKLSTGWFELSTPYLDRHNDYIDVYAKQEKGIITITDAGGTLGFENYNKEQIDKILTTYSVLENNAKAFYVKCNEGDFVQKLHNLISAIIEINALSYA